MQAGVQGHDGKKAYKVTPAVDHFVFQMLHGRKLHRCILLGCQAFFRLFSGMC